MGSAILSAPADEQTGAGDLRAIGHWVPERESVVGFDDSAMAGLAAQPRLTVHLVREGPQGRIGIATGGRADHGGPHGAGALPLLATLPALYPEWLGDRSFGETYGVRFPYVCGEMANGIASVAMVAAMAEADMLGFFGAAGLPLAQIEQAVAELSRRIRPHHAWGVNLIHSPQEPAQEEHLAELLIRAQVPCVSASAFMALTPALIRCAAAGLARDAAGNIVRARQIFAKVSRMEVAERFMSPPSSEALAALLARGAITPQEAELAALLPIAEDVTVEADSGGHTDGRPLTVLLPGILELRAQIMARHPAFPRIRVGAAGGLGTPGAVAAAFALGADYVLTGSLNQAAAESGLSAAAKALLGEADFADVAMAPAADMFELGVKVQVLKRGTLFAARATRLYEAWLRYDGLEAIPDELRARMESEIFRRPLEQAWEQTRAFWSARDPAEVERAEREPKHRMALTFRWYLGMSSRWAISGDPERRADYQIWCGPAMGGFNRWVAGTFLADPAQRSVVQIARNLLEGAAVLTRAHQFRTYGAPVPPAAFHFVPRLLD
jgi:trans-AT polyketide synthase, acyltransferase and oxidoreductase domains